MLQPEDLERAQQEARRLGVSVPVALIRLGAVSERELTEGLRASFGAQMPPTSVARFGLVAPRAFSSNVIVSCEPATRVAIARSHL